MQDKRKANFTTKEREAVIASLTKLLRSDNTVAVEASVKLGVTKKLSGYLQLVHTENNATKTITLTIFVNGGATDIDDTDIPHVPPR